MLYWSKGSLKTRCFFNVSKRGVTKTARLDRLTEVVESALPEGAELIEARFSGGPLLTLLVDREDGPVNHEFCSGIAARVSPMLEEEGYDGLVEVSSPGFDRPLTKPEHFERQAGNKAKVRTNEPMVGGPHDGRQNFTGTIESVTETSVVLKLLEGGVEIELPFGSILRANLKEDI